MGLKGLLVKGAALAALAGVALMPSAASAHAFPAHTINGNATVGPDTVTVINGNQLADSGIVIVGTTTVALSCVEVIQSGPATHLVGMYGTGGGLQWTFTIRQSAAVDYMIVNNAPAAPPADANLCGIGNPGTLGTGVFAVV